MKSSLWTGLPAFIFLVLVPPAAYPETGYPAQIQAGNRQEIGKNESARQQVNKPESASSRVPNRYFKLIQEATEAIRQNPLESTLYLARGWAFYELKKTEEQIADATMAIKLNTKSGRAFFLRADGYLRQGRYQNALGDLTRAIHRGEAGEEVQQYRALVFYYMGRFREAAELNSKILASNPDAEISTIDRGLSSFCMGNFSGALSDIGRVLEREYDPEMTREFDRLRGIFTASGGRNPQAEDEFLVLIKILRDSKNPAPGNHYGKCRSLAI